MDFTIPKTDFEKLNIGVIYLISGPNPEHKYIGQTKMFRINHTKNSLKYFDYIGRFKEHIVAAKYKPTYNVDKIIKQYGTENFSVKLIKYCDPKDLDNCEVEYIKKFNTLHPNGLNIVMGNPHKNCNQKRTSKLLKEYYSNTDIKLKHSLIHRSKFKDIDVDNIQSIELKPIKENNEDKIIYMYIKYNDDTTYRRRYGGIHEDFMDAYNRCLNDAKELTDDNNIIDYTKGEPIQNLGNIKFVELKLHKMNKYNLISLYITNTDVKKWNDKKRFVFGGKTIQLNDAFIKAANFIKKHDIEFEKIKIQSGLMATLPNCWNILRA